MVPAGNNISVCICTYRRPHLLANLLEELQKQNTNNTFSYSVVVVDNDANESARTVVETFKQQSSADIDYFIEAEQNISLARNKAVKNARGNFVAYPESDWLFNLHKTLTESGADAVLGPVLPHYPDDTPEWLIKSKLCERPMFRTGTILPWYKTATSNVLLRNIFGSKNIQFDPSFGRTGGEDVEFFHEMAKSGKVFVWCNEAPVHEVVPRARWEKKFYIRRQLNQGTVTGENIRRRLSSTAISFFLLKCAAWIAVLTIFLPFSIFCGMHVSMRVITKIMYSFGVISGFFKLYAIEEFYSEKGQCIDNH
jgi:succinoglycan biosynthesis protein ExoM